MTNAILSFIHGDEKMRCECGYDFAKDKLAKSPEFDSFLLVHDRDFRKFIRHEIKASQCAALKDKEGAMKALNRSFKYTGGVHLCPACGSLALWRQGMEHVAFYRPAPAPKKRKA